MGRIKETGLVSNETQVQQQRVPEGRVPVASAHAITGCAVLADTFYPLTPLRLGSGHRLKG